MRLELIGEIHPKTLSAQKLLFAESRSHHSQGLATREDLNPSPIDTHITSPASFCRSFSLEVIYKKYQDKPGTK